MRYLREYLSRRSDHETQTFASNGKDKIYQAWLQLQKAKAAPIICDLRDDHRSATCHIYAIAARLHSLGVGWGGSPCPAVTIYQRRVNDRLRGRWVAPGAVPVSDAEILAWSTLTTILIWFVILFSAHRRGKQKVHGFTVAESFFGCMFLPLVLLVAHALDFYHKKKAKQ